MFKIFDLCKDTALDLTVLTGGADLRFLALQPGSAMGGWGPAILCFRTPFLFNLPQISPGTQLELGRLWLSLQGHTTDPRPKPKNWVHWDSNPCPLRQRIPNPAHQPTRPGRLLLTIGNLYNLHPLHQGKKKVEEEALRSLFTLKKCTGTFDFQLNDHLPPSSCKKFFHKHLMC